MSLIPFASGNTLFAVSVNPGTTFNSGPFRALFSGPCDFGDYLRRYDVAPDGRSIVPRTSAAEAPRQLELVLDWFEELKRLALSN